MAIDPGTTTRSYLVLRFAAVGAAGFVVDATILKLMVGLVGWDALSARAVSFPCAVTATWLLNSRYTFRRRQFVCRVGSYASYFVGQALGALLNLGVYAWLIAFNPWFGGKPVTALGAAATVALVFNYTWSSRLVFSRFSTDGRETESQT